MGKAEKTHKAYSSSHINFTKCSIYPDDASIVKPSWRGVTCKNCLKQKK